MTTDVAVLDGGRQQVVESVLFEQGVTAGEEDDIDDAGLDEAGEQRCRVHPGADRPHDAGVAKLDERRQRRVERLVHVIVRIVDEHDVDAVPPEAPAALVEAAQHTVTGEVPASGPPCRDGEACFQVVTGVRTVVGFERPPDLRRHHGVG